MPFPQSLKLDSGDPSSSRSRCIRVHQSRSACHRRSKACTGTAHDVIIARKCRVHQKRDFYSLCIWFATEISSEFLKSAAATVGVKETSDGCFSTVTALQTLLCVRMPTISSIYRVLELNPMEKSSTCRACKGGISSGNKGPLNPNQAKVNLHTFVTASLCCG